MRRGVACGAVCLLLLTSACSVGGSTDEGARSDATSVPVASVDTSDPQQATVPTSQEPDVIESSLPSDDSGDGAQSESPTSPPTTSGAVDPGLGGLVEIAVADLASRLGVAEEDVSVVSADAVVWPDGALGCPQPGMAYRQVKVDGFKIVLSAKGAEYAYHGGGSRGPFLCTEPSG